MKIKPTSNIERRTSNSERVRGDLDAAFDVERSTLDVRCFRPPRHPSPVTRHPQRAVALVITLILLSVTLVMALAFLAISGRERGSVSTQTDTATTRLAADAGLAAAEAQIAANILSTTNPYTFGLLVSMNYLTPITNNPLAFLTSLQYSPRPPVFIPNPTNPSAPPDFRFYLDLNRNGLDDPNGWVTNYDNNGNPIGTSFQIGDPEWIGVLERPDQPYGPNNPFIARYAFIAVPVGNSLDLNAIHNQALTTTKIMNLAQDSYFRNQGVGSWEINLAAFLADLNTNEWDSSLSGGIYQYLQCLQPNFPNSGAAFNDAFGLLAWRYAYLYNSLRPVGGSSPLPPGLFTPSSIVFPPFQNDIDAYDIGPLQTTTAGITVNPPVTVPWLGADNTNHYFTPEELFNTNETASFGFHLLNAGTNTYGGNTIASYDRYTFYRMLSQLGTDTTPESGKMNLNYDNLDIGTNGVLTVTGTASATNFVPWQPLTFFTYAADRMLKAYTTQWFQSGPSNYLQTYYGISGYNYYHLDPTGTYTVANDPSGLGLTNVPLFGMTNQLPAFGVTGIPVMVGVSNQFVYTPAVQRVLQLAANIYDASTNSYFPSVFRPLFSRDQNGYGTNLFISGYTNVPSVVGPGDWQLAPPTNAMALATMPNTFQMLNLATNVYGVPWIIGAKKGFPNFNEFVQENIVGVTRRLQVMRDTNAESTSFPKVFFLKTNQMYILSLNTSFGLDFWNSYNASLPDNVTVVYRGLTYQSITNDDPGFELHPGVPQPMTLPFANMNQFIGWNGSAPWTNPGGQPNPSSFYSVNITAYPILTNSVYRTPNASLTPGTVPAGFTAPCLIGTNYFGTVIGTMAALFETNIVPGTSMFPLPHFGLLTTNQLQVFILDATNGVTNVIDYAQFEQSTNLDLNAAIFTDPSNNAAPPDGVWNTNMDVKNGLPYGIENQIEISEGLKSLPPTAEDGTSEDGTWQGDPEATQYGTTPVQQQASFQAFFKPYGHGVTATVPGWGNYPQATATNFQSVVQAPYAPTRYAVGYVMLQANDPLVHYLASDLAPSFPSGLIDPKGNYNNSISNVPPLTDLDLGALNHNYQPWGGNPAWQQTAPSDFAYNLAERDPLVSQSDFWNFPTNKYPTVGWMGRVHRGTPWQTVYLKATNLLDYVQINNGVTNYAGMNAWATWAGNQNAFDAINAAPVSDRLLFDLFTTAFNDNATRGTLSVNQSADQYDPDGNPADINPAAGLAAWSALFSGIVVPPINNTNPLATYGVISPVGGLALSNSALGILITNINYTRYNFTNADGLAGVFEHKGDILSVPQLTDHLPFIDPAQTNYNSDAMYEWLPQQAMSLLRVGTPRYVIYSYGQTLKPAPNGIYLGPGQFFGMATNYQVMSEMATRAVVRLDTARTNGPGGTIMMTPPRAVIEQFNILPPD